MSMKPMMKKCPKCKRMYDYNPDVGVKSCPYCQGQTLQKIEKIQEIFKKKPK